MCAARKERKEGRDMKDLRFGLKERRVGFGGEGRGRLYRKKKEIGEEACV